MQRSLIDHFDMYIGEHFVKLFKVWYKKVSANCITRTNTDLTSGRSCIKKLCLSFLDQIHSRFNMAEQDLTFRGELDFFGASDKECLIQFPLQCLDRLAYSRLRNKKLLGRL